MGTELETDAPFQAPAAASEQHPVLRHPICILMLSMRVVIVRFARHSAAFCHPGARRRVRGVQIRHAAPVGGAKHLQGVLALRAVWRVRR